MPFQFGSLCELLDTLELSQSRLASTKPRYVSGASPVRSARSCELSFHPQNCGVAGLPPKCRRSLDYGFQKKLADLDGAQLDAQKVAAQTHQTMLEKDLAAHDKNIDAAARTADYLRAKYTNQELYAWNAQRISAIFFQTYQMAFGLAKRAERCFSHELADYGVIVLKLPRETRYMPFSDYPASGRVELSSASRVQKFPPLQAQ